MKAYRLYTTNEGGSAFETGLVTDLLHLEATHFFFHEDPADRREFDWHPAPRAQYVITLRGRMEFTVTDGSTFVIEPGDILIAKDVTGSGHKWRMLSEEAWSRLYVVLKDGQEDGFSAH